MIAIIGITGRIGGHLADNLLASKIAVRGVVRDNSKVAALSAKGCSTAVAELTDVSALTKAFEGAEGVFIMLPPVYDPLPGFDEAYKYATAMRDAVRQAGVKKVVYLSTVGAQAKETNLLSQHTIGETIFGELDIPVTFLRPAWFLENIAWDIPSARDSGVINSFLHPLDKEFAMVATADIGQLASRLIQESWKGHRVVEIEGPTRISPDAIGKILSAILGRPVKVQSVPRDTWTTLFKGQGMKNPGPRIGMLDGFNEGWIDFTTQETDGTRKGTITADTVFRELVQKTQ